MTIIARSDVISYLKGLGTQMADEAVVLIEHLERGWSSAYLQAMKNGQAARLANIDVEHQIKQGYTE